MCKSQNLNKNFILGQFWDVARLDLGSPVSVCLPARPAVMQPSLERQTENMQPLFWKARPAGMTAPKTASDGSKACGYEGHFDVSQQQTPKLGESLEHEIIGSLCCHNNGLCWFLSKAKEEKRICGLRKLLKYSQSSSLFYHPSVVKYISPLY